MSHGEHQLPALRRISAPPPPPPSGYGPAASPSHPLPARTPSPSRVSVPLAVASAGGIARRAAQPHQARAMGRAGVGLAVQRHSRRHRRLHLGRRHLPARRHQDEAAGPRAASPPCRRGRHVGHHKVYEGLVGTAKVIWREEGVRGMYRGPGPDNIGLLTHLGCLVHRLQQEQGVGGAALPCVGLPLPSPSPPRSSSGADSGQTENAFVTSFWSSIIAGASSTIVTNPIWVIKTRLMSQTSNHGRTRFSSFPKGANTPTSRPTLHAPWHYRSTLDAARKMYNARGDPVVLLGPHARPARPDARGRAVPPPTSTSRPSSQAGAWARRRPTAPTTRPTGSASCQLRYCRSSSPAAPHTRTR